MQGNKISRRGHYLCTEGFLCLAAARSQLQLLADDMPHCSLHIFPPWQRLCLSQHQYLQGTCGWLCEIFVLPMTLHATRCAVTGLVILALLQECCTSASDTSLPVEGNTLG